jgi:6-phosphofructokinase 1
MVRVLAVLTSGGDAPGMNAAIRAIVRSGIQRGLSVVGVQHGYSGLMNGDFIDLDAPSVSNIIQRGGTILRTDRSKDFRTSEGRKKAADAMAKRGIDALVAIGGNGTLHGASLLAKEHGIAVVGVPSTIDNDLFGTDWTIGYDTAVNTAIYNIDKIRDTAEALERTFYIEVMGRATGFIALDVGLATGAEYISIPEDEPRLDVLLKLFERQRATKRSNIVIVAEGDSDAAGALELAKRVKEVNSMDYRVTILGHIQRGGSPSARDRILASKLGAFAVDRILDGQTTIMTGEAGGHLTTTPLEEAFTRVKPIDYSLVELSALLSA